MLVFLMPAEVRRSFIMPFLGYMVACLEPRRSHRCTGDVEVDDGSCGNSSPSAAQNADEIGMAGAEADSALVAASAPEIAANLSGVSDLFDP
jgi:hypothetical protein